MNFKINESATKLRGAYYTDPEIAAFLLRWVLNIHPKSILEPSCGDGVFLRSLSILNSNGLKSVKGFEIEPGEVEKSKLAAGGLKNVDVEILSRDFLGWSLAKLLNPPLFDAVVGNPPFIRYQYLDSDLQGISEKIFKFFQLPFTKHTNAWVPFVILSLALLRPGGRLAMVVPSELLHVLHAASLRTFLTKVCSRVLIFDPQELWFEETLQGAILLLAEKKTTEDEHFQGIGIVPTRSKAFLSEDPEEYFAKATYTNGDTVKGKWMLALLTKSEREVLSKAKNHPGIYRFNDIAEVAVGIVTGANKFFLVPDSIVNQYSLQNWAHSMFGRSEHVPGVIYDESTVERNKRLGMPTNFIWFSNEQIEELPDSVKEYIHLGELQNIHTRYKCRIREPWYSVPSVYATSLGMLKRSHDFPRLIFNKVQAYTTDTAYRVRLKKFDESSIVFSFINSLTALTAELEGRHYGGGVLELVPSEIRKLLIPIIKSDEKSIYELDDLMKKGIEPENLFAIQDNKILKPLGFNKEENELLLQAWSRLRLRRQRQEAEELPEEELEVAM
jgi:adenine-specific DNA-methyltransferase